MISVSPTKRHEFEQARREIVRLTQLNDVAIRILTAEQANLALKVLLEARRG